MEKITSNENNNMIKLSKNMLGVMFTFCDLKLVSQLRNVVRKFREVIDSENVLPIFTDFIKEIKFIHREKGMDWEGTEDKNKSYTTKLFNRLKKSYTPIQIDDFISRCFCSLLKVNENTVVFLELMHLDYEPEKNQYERWKCLALKMNSTVTKIIIYFESDINAYWLKLLKELFQSNNTIYSLALRNFVEGSDESLKNICELIKLESNIRELDLTDNRSLFKHPDIFRIMLDCLKQNKNIKEIIFERSSLLQSSKNMIDLCDFMNATNHIQKLNLSNCFSFYCSPLEQELRKNNLPMLFKVLEQNNSLIELDLSINDLGSASLSLSSFLKTNKTLTKLNLRRTKFANSIEEMEAFSEALKSNSTIQELNLGWNLFLEEGKNLEVLSQAIKINKSIKILYLNMIGIGRNSNSFRFLSEVLICNTTILTLHLGDNEIGCYCENIDSLCELIKKNKTIKELYLYGYDIEWINFKDLILALAKNKTINKLGLSCKILLPCDNLVFQDFCEMIKSSTTLKELELLDKQSEEFIPQDCLAYFFTALEENKSLNKVRLFVLRGLISQDETDQLKRLRLKMKILI